MLIQRERELKVIFSILDIFELFASVSFLPKIYQDYSYTLGYVSYHFPLLVPVENIQDN